MGSGSKSQHEDAATEINRYTEGRIYFKQLDSHRGANTENSIKTEKTISSVRISEFSDAPR